MTKRLLLSISFIIASLSLCTAQTTIRQQMDLLQQEHAISFVYDSSLPLDGAYKGASLKGLPLEQALERLFTHANIIYNIQGNHVLLKTGKAKTTNGKSYTVSGYVRDGQGELLINATVYDLTTQQGTMTNEYGHYSLTLPQGDHQLRVTYIGFEQQVHSISLHHNQTLDIHLRASQQLGEVVVTGDLNSPVLGTQMGKRSISQADIKTEFALFSSPDVVKTLQRMSGVQEGVELTSGLYVHGGNNDENLFLLDGTPLYNVNHSLGLFSAFNVDVVKNVDFYKSGFPARYGGRLSSVVDVRTNDGNHDHLHGSYRIGLLDGSVQMDGPLGNRTQFNIGLRRSWLDLLTRPIFAIVNRTNDEEKITLNYAFHDLNAKVTHTLSDRSQLSLSLYSGNDGLSTHDDWQEKKGGEGWTAYSEVIDNKFRWGNLNAALDWRYQLSPQLQANFTAVFTHNRATLRSYDDVRTYDETGETTALTYLEHEYRSTIYDMGYRSEFDFRPSPRHHIRFGHDYTFHLFRPQTNSQLHVWGGYQQADTLSAEGRNRHQAHELSLYGEDQVTLNSRWSLNGGVNISLFATGGKAFASADPRLAVKYQLSPTLSTKASYTLMTQYVHKISNAFLELPTDYWVPTTEHLRPMHSHQLAAGIYWQPTRRWTLMAETYYKLTRHLLQYSSWSGLEPPAEKWDMEVTDGRGRFYGLELDAQYRGKRLQANMAYTLSWNERRFDEFYRGGWYYDKFDNRHKLNLTMRWNISKKTQMYAAWTYHTGNHMTFPTQYVQMPNLPDGKPQQPTDYYSERSYYEERNETKFIYEQPNNITLPAYHRLDLGFNFRHTTKHGHERIWNLSVYNAYCHLNTLWNDIEYTPLESNKVDLAGHQAFRIKTRGYIPIIPSFSYTIKF